MTYVTCTETGEVRLCDPVDRRILSVHEDREVRRDPKDYLARQRKVDMCHLLKKQKAWTALVNHPEAMEKRNGTLVAVAATNL